MATNALPTNTTARRRKSKTLTMADRVQAILAPLASLRLTVVLLSVSVFVIFIITLQQATHDMWEIKSQHYSSLLVTVPFEEVVVERWFPDAPPVPGAFVIPSGLTLIVLMLMNLTAAHLLRFRLQATGLKLWVGAVIAALGAVFTWAIVFNTTTETLLNGRPPIAYDTMWLILQGMIGLLLGACIVGFFVVGKRDESGGNGRIEKTIMASLAFIMGIVLVAVVLLGKDTFVNREGMRIVWQLTQATAAGLVCLVASVMLFRRKGGIVLLHIGLAGLMANELFVSLTNEETQMQIAEGETVAVASDIRATELVVIDQSDDQFDKFVRFPSDQILTPIDGDEVRYQVATHEDLPFTVEVLRYIQNANLVRQRPALDSGIETDGVLRRWVALDANSANGVSANQAVDTAAAYVRVVQKQTMKNLGTFLLSQIGYQNQQIDTVEVDGKPYQIGLRFKADYKPYSLTLKDVQAKMYPGTKTAKWYSSDFVLDDKVANTKSEQKVFMNNPLRYAGETFYQTGYAEDGLGREISTLQIVKNRGWMIPYVCCMFVVIGLVAQFGTSLLSFLEKKQKKVIQAEEQTKLMDRPAEKVSWKKRSALAICVSVFFMLYAAKDVSRATFGSLQHEQMRLDLLGELPITFNGRIQPIESLAKNTLRQLTKREEVYDGENKKQPAMRWLADVMFGADGFEDYRLLRIEDPTVIDALNLTRSFDGGQSGLAMQLANASDPDAKAAIAEELELETGRPSLRYTLDELNDAPATIRSMLPEGLQPEDYSLFQSRLTEVSRKIGKVQAIEVAFGALHAAADDMDFERRINLALNSTRVGLPLLIPSTGGGENESENAGAEIPWSTFAASQDQAWVASMAQRLDVDNYEDLAEGVIEEEMMEDLRDMLMARQSAQSILRNPEMLENAKQALGVDDEEQLTRMLADRWDSVPAEMKGAFEQSLGPIVDQIIAQQKPALIASLVKQFEKIGGLESADAGEISGDAKKYSQLFAKLGPAYRAGDAETFNSALTEYQQTLAASPPVGLSPGRLSAENIYNGANLFYHAMVIFLVAFLLATFGWVGYAKQFNQASFWLLGLGWFLLVIGLVLRIYISGRPPVTNLYSSALFVTAVFVPLMMLVERMTKIGMGNVLGGIGAFLTLMWAWSMTISDGDTFTVLLAVLDTQFWLATHVVCVTIGYGTTFAAGALGVAYILGALFTKKLATKAARQEVAHAMYGMVCLALLFSFFGTVLGGLWGDDSWGRFWGWDPKENGALMIVLWNALSLHARWAGLVRERGFAMIAIFGNIITLWSWKGVNVLGVGLHAYSASNDKTVQVILYVGMFHLLVMAIALVPTKFWNSYRGV
jgi:ABC-type transport system involved in cytochrome c biogenesis permease subunit